MYTAVSLIADIVCKCERQVYQNGNLVRDGTWYTWNVSANSNQSASDLLTRWIFDIYYNDDGGLVIHSGNKLYNADSFAIDEYPMKENIFQSVSVGVVQLNKKYKASDVFYIQLNDERGRSAAHLIDGAFLEYSQLLNSAADGLKKGSGEKYVLSVDHLPRGTSDEDKIYREALKKNLDTFTKSTSAAYPIERGETLTKLSGSSGVSASSYSDIRKDVYNIVAEILHLPASLLDGNMNNTSEVVNQALTFAVGPLCDRLSTEITRKTFTRDEVISGCRVNLDTTQIRVRDVVDVADKLDKLIASGIMCIDEVRAQCSLPELGEDWSKKHYITKNYEGIEAIHPEGGEEA